MGLWAQLDGFVGCFVFVIPGTADVLPVTFTGSYAKLGHFNLWLFPHSGYVPVIAEAKPAYQVERYPLCGASPFLPAIPCVSCICDHRAGDCLSSSLTIIIAGAIIHAEPDGPLAIEVCGSGGEWIHSHAHTSPK